MICKAMEMQNPRNRKRKRPGKFPSLMPTQPRQAPSAMERTAERIVPDVPLCGFFSFLSILSPAHIFIITDFPLDANA